jgi:hypothetical protein
MKKIILTLGLFTTAGWCSDLAFSDNTQVADFVKLVENSDYFNPGEKMFARKLLSGAKMDDTVLDAIMDSPLLTDKNKEYAKKFFETGKKPKQIQYKEEKFDREFELVSPRLRFSGDLDASIRSVDTAHDISDFFALDNADYDPGITHVMKGQVRYRYEEVKRDDVWGIFDFDIQGEDGEYEKLNFHIQNRDNYYQLGTMLTPHMSEFGMRNTEISGIAGHFEKEKWILDFVRGDSVEDYISALDGLSLGGLVVKRQIGNEGRDWAGVQYYDWSGTHYMGFLGQINPAKGLRLSTEFMKKDSQLIGRDGNAFELEADYQNDKLKARNEFQYFGTYWDSVLNPEYANFSGVFSERFQFENSLTYRFDPYVTSSLTRWSRTEKPEGGGPEVQTQDYSWVLMTQVPERPKYMFVLKTATKDDGGSVIDEDRLIAMARTTFKARDILTNVDYMLTDYQDNVTTGNSYVLNSFAVDVSRPFLSKLWIREKMAFLQQNYTNDNRSNESQNHLLEATYKFDSKNSIRGSHRYRRTARKSLANKYKTVYSVEARRIVDENTTYKLRMDSYNYNEYGKGYDANLVSVGADFRF